MITSGTLSLTNNTIAISIWYSATMFMMGNEHTNYIDTMSSDIVTIVVVDGHQIRHYRSYLSCSS